MDAAHHRRHGDAACGGNIAHAQCFEEVLDCGRVEQESQDDYAGRVKQHLRRERAEQR